MVTPSDSAGSSRDLREAEPPLVPFHWEVELPEVFERERPGFDAIVGNPPFGGKNNIESANPDYYLDWLKELHEESHGNADVVAHFYRRSFNYVAKRWHIRTHRDKHHRPGGHTFNRTALDLHPRRRDLQRSQACSSGQDVRRLWSASCIS